MPSLRKLPFVLFRSLNLFSTSISLLTFNIFLWHKTDYYGDYFKSWFNSHDDLFDFIVVGGGSSGAVVVNRLVTNGFSVLLLEAGGEPFVLTNIPGAALGLLNHPYIDYQYQTTPQKNACLGMKNQRCNWARGKALGGSSNLNFLQYARGNPQDFEQWAFLTGDIRWGYKNVLEYFKRSEDYNESGDNNYHGRGGPLKLSYPPFISKVTEYFIRAGLEKGYPKVDLNGPNNLGFDKVVYTQDKGQRYGTLKAFINPVRHRSNLKIYKFATVHRVLFRGGSNEAYGVVYERFGKMHKAYAKKEVILSAGSIGSAKILMLSGFGPKWHLETLGIPVKANLPVGQNMQDHMGTYLTFTVDKPLTLKPEREWIHESVFDFFGKGQGILTTTGLMATAFVSAKHSVIDSLRPIVQWPDTQWIFLGVSIFPEGAKLTEYAFNFKEGIVYEYFKDIFEKDSFQICSILSRPKSRGQILLKSRNPNDTPLIDPNYLFEREDVNTVVTGMKRAIDLIENSTTFQMIGGKLTSRSFPGCEHYPFRSDAYYECHVKSFTFTIFHPTSTCAMGHKTDQNSVVDTDLRVKQAKNLRVIDASIMPRIVNSNTNAACIMIGEIGSDMVIHSWKNKR